MLNINVPVLEEDEVLIVAKCIVNCLYSAYISFNIRVLIVAKCIVNFFVEIWQRRYDRVLIVAKCIVNVYLMHSYISKPVSINSSKVYCKCKYLAYILSISHCINSSKVYCKFVIVF